MFFFPFFTNLFSQRCDCADRVIEYLENEKYTYIPREMTPGQRKEAEDWIKEKFGEIDRFFDERGMTNSLNKIQMKHNLMRDMFNQKVLKDSIK